jgi:AcrR family transcriptional regulator
VSGLADTADPISVMQEAFRRYVRQDIASGSWLNGCPLNNMAQEMTPLDQGFRERILVLYDSWRSAIVAALARGIEAGAVRADASPEGTAALVVAAQMGIWGTGKSSRNARLMRAACDAVCDYLERVRP